MEDQEIIALYWLRDETAIRETDRKYGAFCHSLAMNVLSVREDAEECVSDTYHRAWEAIPPERPTAFRAWLGRIVRNLSINRWRHDRAQKRYAGAEVLLSELADCIPSPERTEEVLEGEALAEHICGWLDALPQADRRLFLLRYWNGEALKTLAPAWGTTPNKLAGRMLRLRKSLGAYLTERGVAL